jgi:hypothetical protein
VAMACSTVSPLLRTHRVPATSPPCPLVATCAVAEAACHDGAFTCAAFYDTYDSDGVATASTVTYNCSSGEVACLGAGSTGNTLCEANHYCPDAATQTACPNGAHK